MKLFEIVKEKEIVLVCGKLSSGKGQYIRENYPEYDHVGVSSIVKKLSGFDKRSDLSTTANLDSAIVQMLIKTIDESDDKVVVDGIRQPSILYMLKNHYGSRIKDIIWLDVPENARRERFAKREASKDDQSFEKAMKGDSALGIDDVETYIRGHHRVVPY